MCAHCPLTFIDVEDGSWMCFSYFMNNRILTDLPYKMIPVSLICVTKWNTFDKLLFCFLCCLLKNGKFATFVFLSFQLKLQFFKYSMLVLSENSHALPKNIVLICSKIFFNSKFWFSRKCQNKSVCVRRFLCV